MDWNEGNILEVLDGCARAFTFPMLDNGYVYLAATRLSLHRSELDWGLVIEVFGFSPRAGLPDLHVYTFSNRIQRQQTQEDFVSVEAFEQHVRENAHNESCFYYPLDEGEWQDSEDLESLSKDASSIMIRGESVLIPAVGDWAEFSVEVEEPRNPRVYELCRVLAAQHRDRVLATTEERRRSLPTTQEILVLDDWNHPDVVDEDCPPSTSETFRQLARVLATGDTAEYRPTLKGNTHWSNWPEGGTL